MRLACQRGWPSGWRRVAKALLLTCVGVVLTSCFASRLDSGVGRDTRVGTGPFRREMIRSASTPFIQGNKVTTLRNGRAFFPPMLESIRGAQKTITFETFAFVNAPVTREFSKVLAERARAGVAVKLILDDVGSANAGEKNVRMMREAGVEVRFYHPVNILRPRYSNNRTHRKILVVDGRLAYTGGAGFADAWTGDAGGRGHWRDTQYEISGPAVAEFQKAFRENWLELTGEDLKGDSYFPKLAATGDLAVQVVFDDPWNEGNPLAQGTVAAINGARESLVLQQSYFVPNRRFRDLLLEASRRGVRVEVMVPDTGIDSRVTRYASQNHWAELLRGGIRIHQYEGTMMHGKLLVADECFSIVGSANLDDRSYFINEEINLHVDSRRFALEQLEMFRDDLKVSREITLENLETVLEPGFKRFFARFFESQL